MRQYNRFKRSEVQKSPTLAQGRVGKKRLYNSFSPYWTRRQVLHLGIASLILPFTVSQLSACEKQNLLTMESSKQADASATKGRLSSRPKIPTEKAASGLHPLGLNEQRDGFIYVPKTYRPDRLTPLVLMLHGAGGNAEGGLKILRKLADSFQTILLAVDSRLQTWDIIRGGYGPDIAFIDQALAQTFSRYAIDPNRVAIAGFSDGASYALSVGVTNGDLFSHIIAFSPGFMAPASQVGQPRVFISHGTWDTVLPIERCSRRIVPQLQRAGYDVQYQEFSGIHTVPGAIARQSLDWLTQAAADGK